MSTPIELTTLATPVDRESVRALATAHFDALKGAALAGGNAHQLSLDQGDQVSAFASKLSEDDAATFLALYAQELGACSNAALDEVARLNTATATNLTQTAVQASQAATWISLISFFAFLIFIISIFKK